MNNQKHDGPVRLHFKVAKSEEMELAQFLSLKTQLSKSECKKVIDFGGVWIQINKGPKKRIKRATHMLIESNQVEFNYDKKLLSIPAYDFQEISSHKDWVVCFKPAGMLTQGSPFGDAGSLEWCLQKKYNKIFMVHRLDRETSGLIIFAKNNHACRDLSQLFITQQFEKIYLAETIKGNTQAPTNDAILDFPVEGKSSQTKVLNCHEQPDKFQFKLTLLTGRKHQIRIHLDHIGLPILGDPRYGKMNSNSEGLRLQASEIKFTYQKQTYHFIVPDHAKLF
jgi:tRNA pseudouridine32 synthase/23S rRNA pseudouridine746 synthase